ASATAAKAAPTAVAPARLAVVPAQTATPVAIAAAPRPDFALSLKNETQEMERHARLLVQSQAVGDLPGVRRHAEHIFNLVVGARGENFGDLDGDGRAQNAGDGFGLLVNGEQPGYIRATLDAATAAASAADTVPTIKVHARYIAVSAD